MSDVLRISIRRQNYGLLNNRSIIHINVADFAVAVERVLDRRLDDRPVIVAPEGAARATVYDMSEEAFQAGVRKHMPLSRALRRCRDARVLPPRPDRYGQAMARMLKSALPCSPFIEPGDGDGHLFVDVTGSSRLLGPPVDVAWRLGRRIRRDLGLVPIWSVATSKLIAKTATRLVKPLGEYIVEPGDEAAFLAPLPLFLVPGIESSDLARLNDFNMVRVFQAATLSADQMQTLFGHRGRFIHDRLRGIDPSPVRPVDQPPPRVIESREFGDDTNDRCRWSAACISWWKRPADSCGARPWPPGGSLWFWSTPTASSESARQQPHRPRPTISPFSPMPGGCWIWPGPGGSGCGA
jgi:DNA polymerase-4